jgi:hypothetical protein
VLQAASEEIYFIAVNTCLKMLTVGHCPLPEVSNIQSTNPSPLSPSYISTLSPKVILDLRRIPVTVESKTSLCGRLNPARGHGYLSFVSDVCCQVEVPATGRSLVNRIPTQYVCVCP